MKTLEEIKAHLSTTVYDEESKQTITGFLIGKEIGKEEGLLDIEFDLPQSFDDFKSWFDESEEEHPKAKVLKDEKWFDITFDEICGNLKKYNPVIFDGVVSDDIIDKIYKEISGEKPKYKYVGKERENLIKHKELLMFLVEDNEKNKGVDNPLRNIMINFFNDCWEKEIKNIDDKLRETVD